MQLTNEEEVNREDEISKEEGNERRDRRGGDGEISDDFDRWSDRNYLEKFAEIFSGDSDRDGEGKQNKPKESSGKSGDSEWDSEYEGYKEW